MDMLSFRSVSESSKRNLSLEKLLEFHSLVIAAQSAMGGKEASKAVKSHIKLLRKSIPGEDHTDLNEFLALARGGGI